MPIRTAMKEDYRLTRDEKYDIGHYGTDHITDEYQRKRDESTKEILT